MIAPCDLVAVVDDDHDLRAALVQAIELEGWRVLSFPDAASALASVDRSFAGVIVTDLRMPGIDGSGLFARLSELDPDLPVIIMTGHGDIPVAVDLMGRGAYDFIPKPFSSQRLLSSIGRALEKRTLVLENRALREAADAGVGKGFVGTSQHAIGVRHSLTTLARADCPVLFEGEQGVGKSLCTRLLHRMSARSRNDLIVVDCAALDEVTGPASLLGHVSGAVPGVHQPRAGAIRRADRGTIVLDNIDRIPGSLHRTIERAIETASVVPIGGDMPLPVDVAWAVTTSRPLAVLVEEGHFPRSLYLRLAGARLAIAPLRERRDDAAALFAHFLAELVETTPRSFPVVQPDILARLRTGSFPANAHEVRMLAEETVLGLGTMTKEASVHHLQAGLREAVAAYEAEFIRAALSETGGDVELARARLDLPRKTLYDKLARHGIVAADFRRS